MSVLVVLTTDIIVEEGVGIERQLHAFDMTDSCAHEDRAFGLGLGLPAPRSSIRVLLDGAAGHPVNATVVCDASAVLVDVSLYSKERCQSSGVYVTAKCGRIPDRLTFSLPGSGSVFV